MLDKQDKTIGQMDQILGKQDDLKSAVVNGFSDLKEEHVKTRKMSMEIFHSEVKGAEAGDKLFAFKY